MNWNEGEGREAWDISGVSSSPNAQFAVQLGVQWPLSGQSSRLRSLEPFCILLLVSASTLGTKHADFTVACRIPQPEATPGRRQAKVPLLP